MDPEKKSLNFIFPTKYVIPKSLKFSHWLSEQKNCQFLLRTWEICAGTPRRSQIQFYFQVTQEIG